MNQPVDDTREAWLGRAAKAIAETILEGHAVPPLRISVGFAHRSSKATGQCWPAQAAEDGVNQVFIAPMRGEANTVDILGTVLHEMIHAVDDCQSGHKGNFIVIARSVGLLPKFTSSMNRTEELTERLGGIAERLGAFPHAALDVMGRAADTPKKQEARMLKVVCPDDGYLVRTTAKWLEVGMPSCPCGTEMGLG